MEVKGKIRKDAVILSSIMKNESKIVTRCLESARHLYDAVVICDTGSTDDMDKIIISWCEKNNVPCLVYYEPFQDFEHNRTNCFERTVKYAQENGVDLNKSYALLLDADMKIVGTRPTNLVNISYLVTQKSSCTSYSNVRYIKLAFPAKCIGLTHEYWSTPQDRAAIDEKIFYIDDKEDGGCKSDKFVRDERLLRKQYDRDNKDVRAMFYLANTLMSLNKNEEAIEWYEKRIKAGGWEEEVWNSKYKIGDIWNVKIKDKDKAISAYLDAFNYRPTRAEALLKLVLIFHDKYQHEVAMRFIKMGLATPMPKDLLFIEHNIYNCEFHMKAFISLPYLNKREEALKLAHSLVFDPASTHTRGIVYYNMIHFKQFTTPKEKGVEELKLEEDVGNFIVNYKKDEPEFIHIYKDGTFGLAGGEKFKGNKVQLVKNTNGTFVFFIEDGKVKFGNLTKKGFEFKNCKMFETKFQTSTSKSQLNCDLQGKILAEEKVEKKEKDLEVSDLKHQDFTYVTIGDKIVLTHNFLGEGMEIDIKTGLANPLVLAKNTENGNFTCLRCIIPPVEHKDGFLAITLESFSHDKKMTNYSRFVLLDKKLKVISSSQPFTFSGNESIEFVLSMTKRKNKFVIGCVSVNGEERKNFVYSMTFGEIEKMLIKFVPLKQLDTSKW